VTSLTMFLKDVKNPEKQREFALATKSVGDSINELVVAADSTAITKILDAVADCRDAQRQLLDSASSSVEAMLSSARFVGGSPSVHLAVVVSPFRTASPYFSLLVVVLNGVVLCWVCARVTSRVRIFVRVCVCVCVFLCLDMCVYVYLCVRTRIFTT
jgi:uncharacterized membrane protein YsdA (DUF1294 family)